MTDYYEFTLVKTVGGFRRIVTAKIDMVEYLQSENRIQLIQDTLDRLAALANEKITTNLGKAN